MAFLAFRVPGYANDIYMRGINRFTARDGYLGIDTEYYVPVQQYANTNFDILALDNALSHGWINQQEYDETKSYGTMPAVKYPPGSAPVAPTE